MLTKGLARTFAVLVTAAALGAPGALARAAQTNAPAVSKNASRLDDLFPDEVLAKGKGVEVKRSELDNQLANLKSGAAAQGRAFSPDETLRLEARMLDRLVQIQLLLGIKTDADQARGKEECAAKFEQFKTRMGSEEALNRQLKAAGLTQEELRSHMTDELTAQAALQREMKISVSPDEVKKYYDDNPAKFEQAEMVRVSQILLATRDLKTGNELSSDRKSAKRKLAEELVKRARAGEDFAKLVKEYSEDPGSKDSGGEYTFARASADPQHAMVPEFEGAAFSLKTNEVSDVVTTQYGYHVIKLLEKIPAKQVAFEKVAPDIKEYLIRQAIDKRQPEIAAYLEKLKKDAGVQILDEKLKQAVQAEAAAAASHPPATTATVKPETKPETK